MGTSERRLEIMKYLCRKRHSTIKELAEMFGVSIRTIQRDIPELETIFHLPLEVKSGKYGGGIYVLENYTWDRMYMSDEETVLLQKIKLLVQNQLSNEEKQQLDRIIKNYSRIA